MEQDSYSDNTDNTSYSEDEDDGSAVPGEFLFIATKV